MEFGIGAAILLAGMIGYVAGMMSKPVRYDVANHRDALRRAAWDAEFRQTKQRERN